MALDLLHCRVLENTAFSAILGFTGPPPFIYILLVLSVTLCIPGHLMRTRARSRAAKVLGSALIGLSFAIILGIGLLRWIFGIGIFYQIRDWLGRQ